jgi:hypothetical protein
MLVWLLAAQVAAATPTYATPALDSLIALAARRNRTVPPDLVSYRAEVESEISVVARRPDGGEGVISIEQVHNDVRWRRPGTFDQHVTGYRQQSVGITMSALGFFEQAWTVPLLYGNRISVMFGRDTTLANERRRLRRRQPLVAVHPLAADRDRVYRFSGGDTVVTMRSGGRAIPIMRVDVELRDDAPPGTVAFRGEMDLDATRLVLVRLRGYFVTIDPPRSFVDRALTVSGVKGIAFIELENSEVEGAWWLPTYQRFEAQATWPLATDARSVFRIVSRFRRLMPNDTSFIPDDDSLAALPHRLTYAPRDSLARFSNWDRDLGAASRAVSSNDFQDVAPDAWRPTGIPLLSLRVRRLADAFHFNRVEGAYTGFGVEYRLRDAAPGLVLRANAGWAWSEGTMRGRVEGTWQRGAVTWQVTGGRGLELTNDFRSEFDSGTTVGALLFGVDDYDYVDRQWAQAGVTITLGRGRSGVLRLAAGPARDGAVSRTVMRSPLSRQDFRTNRGVQPGRYVRINGSLELHPEASAELMQTGVGAMLRAEYATGDLSYGRIEGRVNTRANRGAFTLAGRADVGVVLGTRPPPQQLFELGASQNLPGYGYKEFAGTEAAVLRGLVMYRLPMQGAPLRLGRWVLPSLAPALSGGVQSGWTGVHGEGGRAAIEALGLAGAGDFVPEGTPLSRTTGTVRTTISGGLRFLGGALGIGVARPVDHHGRWRVVVEFAQVL